MPVASAQVTVSDGAVIETVTISFGSQGDTIPMPFYTGPFNVVGQIPPGFPAADLLRSQTSHTSSDWYFEMVFNVAANIAQVGVGIDNNAESLTQAAGQAGGICWHGNGRVDYNGVIGAYSAPTYVVGNVLQVNPKLTAGTIGFAVNGGSVTTVSIAAIVGGPMFALAQLATDFDQVTATFTAPFAFTAPSTAWG